MEHEGSLRCSRSTVTETYPKPDESGSRPHIYLLSSHLRLIIIMIINNSINGKTTLLSRSLP
jgi:hypothetical protein